MTTKTDKTRRDVLDTKGNPVRREVMDMMAVNMLVRTLHLIKTRPAQESAFIAAVNLQNVEKHYGVVVSEIIGDGKWADRENT